MENRLQAIDINAKIIFKLLIGIRLSASNTQNKVKLQFPSLIFDQILYFPLTFF